MSKCLEIAVTFIVSAFILSSVSFADDSVTITTYYPAPYGVYKEMRLYPNTSPNDCDANNKGAIYYDNSETQMKVCDGASWQGLGGGCSDVPGADQSNCWKDVDGDAYSPRGGDCDETCSTCFTGSTNFTVTRDGKDQNCNGIIDNAKAISKTCGNSTVPPPPSNLCNVVGRSRLASFCSSYCNSVGSSYSNYNCTNFVSGGMYYADVNFSTCTSTSASQYLDPLGNCMLGTVPDGDCGTVTCICGDVFY